MESPVVVVGSGPIGAVVARRIAEAGRAVTVLESGPAISDPPGSHVRNQARFTREPDSYFAGIASDFRYFDDAAAPPGLPGACVTAAVGGQGVLWTNNCPRPTAPERGGLLSDAEWDRYLDDAECYLGVADDTFAGSVRQQRILDRLGPTLATAGREIRAQPMAGHLVDIPGRSAPARRLVDPATIHYVATSDILAGTGVRIDFGDVQRVIVEQGRVRAVRLAGGTTMETSAVVVAAGAFDTPILLHCSGIRPPALGRYLTYHPVLYSQLVLDPSLCGDPGDLPPRLWIPPAPGAPWNTMVLRDTNPVPPAPPDVDVPAERLVEMQTFCPVDNHPDNTMTITDDGSVRFDVPLREADQARMAAAVADQQELSTALGRFRAGLEPQWMTLGFAHVMGTCRMGSRDDGTCVTDEFGQVWGAENLYLATVGVIPNALAVNPTLTGAALAIRSADRLLAG
ncbi:choline dehydrogenase-like flavoprotein [Mycolicibacterium sp. BK634]|uniref:GMC oxidoreductase n=1 Tax=Mycolicibacterium sp. BK634 TaxID=2587099 RepID=UPI00184ED2AF|nr:choline dehydrogenase-like flavoprotein [Mycolicibacterium sp. BK634]